MKIALVLLTIKKSELLEEFILKLASDVYEIFIIEDIHEDKYVKKGYTGMTDYKPVTSWDIAMYRFTRSEMQIFDYVWFVEEDVFIPSIDTISGIDKKYPTEDLLTQANFRNDTNKDWHYWKKISKKHYEKPWFSSMVCACRVSRKFLSLLRKFVKREKTLIFCEIIFTTLAYHEKLSIANPIELSSIVYRHDWTTPEEIAKLSLNNLYHPMKDLIIQKK